MFSLYLFALVVGGGLLLFSLFGGGEDAGGGAGDADITGGNPVQWLSLRSLMYFLFVFGGIGAVLSKSWGAAAAPLVAVFAVVGGLGVGAAVSAAFNYLRRTDTGSRDGDETFIGLSGRVTLPFGEGGRGKVLVTRSDRTFELIAQPFGEVTSDPRTWTTVVVVEMSGGTALVTPLDVRSSDEVPSLDHP